MKVLVFDTETTGLPLPPSAKLDKQPRIIEFYGLLFDDRKGKELQELELLFDPGFPISATITKITSITNEMLKGQPTFHSQVTKIIDIFSKADCVVAHNLTFDRQMMELEFARLPRVPRIELPWPKRQKCSVEATEHLKGFRLSLSKLHEELFGETFSGAHRARVDVAALKKCWMELKKRELV